MGSPRTNEDLFAAAGRYGYLHPSYAESFVEAGEVRHLRRSGGWVLTRAIPDSERRDALVGYPRLVAREPRGLREDLQAIAALADVVTVSAVTDPLSTLDEELLRPSFPDVVRVDAQHYVVDLVSFWPARDHRRAARAALRLIDVEVEDAPADLVAGWEALGGAGLPGTELGLSAESLARGLALPGCVAFRALADDGPLALAVVYLSGDDATLHAMASSAAGEAAGARFALMQTIVEDMAGRGLRALDLGSAEADPAFFDGWTDDLRPSYRCGRIVDRVAYDELVAAAGAAGSAVFPAYRDPAARLGR
ncbi:MAG: hypothetical protein AB1Z66_01130 [Candidatus Limnocylindrales bacterium]